MRKRVNHSNRDFKCFLLIAILIGIGIVGRQEYDIYQLKQEQQATQQRIEALKKQKAELEAERRRLDDPRYIEKLAREDYNMVGKNEVPLFIVEEQK